MCRNGRQGGNVKPHHHKLKPVSEPNKITRDNFGALKSDTGIKNRGKSKYTKHCDTSTGKEDKGHYIEVLLMDSW